MRDLRVDTQLAAYLLNPADNRYDLGELLYQYAGLELPESGPPDGQLDLECDQEDPAAEPCRAALAVDRLVGPITEAMTSQGSSGLHDDLEVPLVRVLARMEHRGIGVDPVALTRIRDELTAETDGLRAAVIAEAGHDFNVNSTKQLREVLFDELGLTPGKKTKTGYSTDAQSLEKMRGEHPIVDHLLAYREIREAPLHLRRGSRGRGGEGNRIRATFNQTVARTGRLSSDQPNLHNIPVRSERGRSSGPPSSRRRATSCSSPTTTRSNCAASPTWPRIPA